MPSEVDWAYLAGLIDGEGTLGVYSRSRQHRGSRQITSSRSYRPRIQIANTSLDLMEWLVATFGGRFMTRRTPDGWKQAYYWLTSDVRYIQTICVNTLPYLRIKREQAELVLEFPWGVRLNQWQPEAVLSLHAAKEALYERTLVLNRTGAR